MPPRRRPRGRPAGGARGRRARTPPVLDHRSDLDSLSSGDEAPQAPVAVQIPAQQVMPGPDGPPPVLQPQPPTIDHRLEQMQLMLSMQNARIEGMMERMEQQNQPIAAAQGRNPENVQNQGQLYQLPPPQYQQPQQGRVQDPFQQALAQGAMTAAGFHFPPLQEQGESPLAPFLLLGSVVENTIKAKIWEGRYIDLGTLSHASPQPSLALNWNGESTSISMAAPKPSAPTTFREWQDLFLIYATIMIEVRPQEAAGLFTYIARIGELEATDGNLVWYDYDIAFRKLRAMKQDLPWQKTVMELLWPIQKRRQAASLKPTVQNSNSNQRSNQPFQRASGGPPPPETCHCYYFKGYCKNIANCSYKHICGHCQKSGHSLSKCHQYRNNSNRRQSKPQSSNARPSSNGSKQT